jgi:rfaE bifunctional protein kinase chain/domain
MILTHSRLEQILARIPSLRVGVVGDVFLDRYLDIDPRLTELSIETGLDAYQVIAVRSLPGAAGTVLNNLAALGVQRVDVVSVLGDDGEGYELRAALRRLQVVTDQGLMSCSSRRTPTYTKPMLVPPPGSSGLPRELNRLDIKNRRPVPDEAEEHVLQAVSRLWPDVDALLVVDQVSEADCGVITRRLRDLLAELGKSDPRRRILADSRERIGLFREVTLKPNDKECLKASNEQDLASAVRQLARRCHRPVFCTCAAQGMIVADPREPDCDSWHIPAYAVAGPIDPVGAGDSSSAGLACALAAQATLPEAAAFANLVASITIQQLGTTGTASPAQIRQRWQEIGRATG